MACSDPQPLGLPIEIFKHFLNYVDDDDMIWLAMVNCNINEAVNSNTYVPNDSDSFVKSLTRAKLIPRFGIKVDSSLLVAAIKKEDMNVIKHMFDNYYPPKSVEEYHPPDLSHEELINYYELIECQYDADYCAEAAAINNMKILLYLVQKGCDLTDLTLAHAFANQNLKMINWLIAADCPVSRTSALMAFETARIDILELCIEGGGIIDSSIINYYKDPKYNAVRDYALSICEDIAYNAPYTTPRD